MEQSEACLNGPNSWLACSWPTLLSSQVEDTSWLLGQSETNKTLKVSINIEDEMGIVQERDRIVESAAEKFLSQGISKVTLDEIANDLRMSKKTVYKFFPSKDELLKSMVQIMLGRVEKQVNAIVLSDKPFPEKMTEFMAFVGKFIGRLSTQFVRDMQRFAPSLWKEVESSLPLERSRNLPARAHFRQTRCNVRSGTTGRLLPA
ncbi:MAG: transcriptional regulator, TetR family [Bacteroidetes bacterium]|nr:transcriptional regulator, TetR family [Bacteroidota bacterium]